MKRNRNNTWVKLYRKLREHPIYQNAEHFKLFVFLIWEAAWGDYTIEKYDKKYRLQRGQLITCREDLAEEMNKSEASIDKYLKSLQIEYDVIQKINIGKKYKITIKNYDKYQK